MQFAFSFSAIQITCSPKPLVSGNAFESVVRMKKNYALLFGIIFPAALFGQSLPQLCDLGCLLCDLISFCDNTTCICVTVLPVEITRFEAETVNEKIKLSWTSEVEVNSDYYTIEKSTNGNDFFFFRNINGAGNSNTNINYTLVDDEPAIGTNYYRLKQTDLNGKSKYYAQRKADYFPSETIFKIIQQENSLKIIVATEQQSNGKIILTNLLGENLFYKTFRFEKGSNEVILNFSKRDSKVFFVNVSINEKVYTKALADF